MILILIFKSNTDMCHKGMVWSNRPRVIHVIFNSTKETGRQAKITNGVTSYYIISYGKEEEEL